MPNKHALAIGVSNYPQDVPDAEPLPILPTAVRDAEAVCQMLRDRDLAGFTTVELLLNPDKSRMEKAVHTLFSNREKHDLLFLYFSGHGVKDLDGRLYLGSCETRCQADGSINKVSALAAAQCHDFIRDCRAQRKVIILDCCYSGRFAEGMPLKAGQGTLDLKEILGGKGIDLLSSSDRFEVSYERPDGGLSVYTHHLLEGIRTGAADKNEDGKIDTREAHDYVKQKTTDEVPGMNPCLFLGMDHDPIILAEAPHTLALQRYRKIVEEVNRYNKDPSNLIRRMILSHVRRQLGVDEPEASNLRDLSLARERRHQEKLAEYRGALDYTYRGGGIGSSDQGLLDMLQSSLGLTDEDIAPLLEPCSTKPPSTDSDDPQPSPPPDESGQDQGHPDVFPDPGTIGSNPQLRREIKQRFAQLEAAGANRDGQGAGGTIHEIFEREFKIETGMSWKAIWGWPEAAADTIIDYLNAKISGGQRAMLKKLSMVPSDGELFMRERKVLDRLGLKPSSAEVTDALNRYFSVPSREELGGTTYWQWVLYLEGLPKRGTNERWRSSSSDLGA